MCDKHSDDPSYIDDIAPDVLAAIKKDRFLERLDDLFCPVDPSNQRVTCGHSFEHSVNILRSLGMDSDDVADVLEVLKSRGGCCDCEVLFNVAEESRLKAAYWKARASKVLDNGLPLGGKAS
jgi:hypothetical protein